MKFDIVKYIEDLCVSYSKGYATKADTLLRIKWALDDDSWQTKCDGKEVIDDRVTLQDKPKVEYYTHPDWCIEDKTEE